MKVFWLNTVVFATLFTYFSGYGDDFSLRDCAVSLRTLSEFYQEALIGKRQNPYQDFLDQSSESGSLKSPENPNGLYTFETEITQLLERLTSVAPEFREAVRGDPAEVEFARRWNLAPEILQDVLSYYALEIYDGNSEVVGEYHRTFERQRELAREDFYRQKDLPVIQRLPYYRDNILHLSVPEMAQALNISEGQVYADTSRLGRLIEESFQEELGDRRRTAICESLTQASRGGLCQFVLSRDSLVNSINRLREQGSISETDMRSFYDIGDDAWAFYQHHRGEQPRGISWNRIIEYGGRHYIEAELLSSLFDQGLSHQVIADQLNAITGARAGSENFRTSGSVSQKLSALGLVRNESRQENAPTVYDASYGYLKQGGKLVPAAALRFISDHNQEHDKSWLAERLQVEESSFDKFLERHHVVLAGQVGTNERRRRYAGQRPIVRAALRWYGEHNRYPTQSDFGTEPHQINVTWREVEAAFTDINSLHQTMRVAQTSSKLSEEQWSQFLDKETGVFAGFKTYLSGFMSKKDKETDGPLNQFLEVARRVEDETERNNVILELKLTGLTLGDGASAPRSDRKPARDRVYAGWEVLVESYNRRHPEKQVTEEERFTIEGVRKVLGVKKLLSEYSKDQQEVFMNKETGALAGFKKYLSSFMSQKDENTDGPLNKFLEVARGIEDETERNNVIRELNLICIKTSDGAQALRSSGKPARDRVYAGWKVLVESHNRRYPQNQVTEEERFTIEGVRKVLGVKKLLSEYSKDQQDAFMNKETGALAGFKKYLSGFISKKDENTDGPLNQFLEVARRIEDETERNNVIRELKLSGIKMSDGFYAPRSDRKPARDRVYAGWEVLVDSHNRRHHPQNQVTEEERFTIEGVRKVLGKN